MDDPGVIIYAILVLGGLAYIIFFRPKAKGKRDALIFDSRAMGFLDAIILSGVHFKCTDDEMRRYLENQLAQAHKLSSTETLIEHTSKRGGFYSTHTGLYGDHALFVILCILQHAKECDDDELLAWCESKLILASKVHFNYSENQKYR